MSVLILLAGSHWYSGSAISPPLRAGMQEICDHSLAILVEPPGSSAMGRLLNLSLKRVLMKAAQQNRLKFQATTIRGAIGVDRVLKEAMACSGFALLRCLPTPAKAEAAGRARPLSRLRYQKPQSQWYLFTRQRRGYRPASRQQVAIYRQKDGTDTLPFALGRGDRHMQHNLNRSACMSCSTSSADAFYPMWRPADCHC